MVSSDTKFYHGHSTDRHVFLCEWFSNHASHAFVSLSTPPLWWIYYSIKNSNLCKLRLSLTYETEPYPSNPTFHFFLKFELEWDSDLEWLGRKSFKWAFYKKFTTVPFTGDISPSSDEPYKGSIKDGKPIGLWEYYRSNGLLKARRMFHGQEGLDGETLMLEEYFDDGHLSVKRAYRGLIPHGTWEFFYSDVQL